MDDADSNSRPENVAPRRSRRGNDNEKDDKTKQREEEEEGDDLVEEDVTRCVCGQADYPGPPASIRDFAHHQTPKAGSKDGSGPNDDANTSDTLSDDVGNFFIQCDNCHVWQHGGCVGLTDESMSPEFYYCEECKPEVHKIIKTSSGYVCGLSYAHQAVQTLQGDSRGLSPKARPLLHHNGGLPSLSSTQDTQLALLETIELIHEWP